MTDSKFKWCFIGTGKLANQVASQILKSGRHEIVSCYTRNPEKGRLFAEKYGCAACGSAEEAISLIQSTGVIENGIDTGEEVTMTYPDGLKVSISASITDFKGLEKMIITGESGSVRAPFYHMAGKIVCRKSLFRREVFRLPKGSGTSYLYEFDTVADEIRRGLKESERVPLRCTSDVMHMLDKIRDQIGLVYDDLE